MATGPQSGRSRPSPVQYAKRLLPPLRQTELLVLGFPRRILHQGKYYDPYADMLVKALDMDHLILERPQEGHLSPVPNPTSDTWTRGMASGISATSCVVSCGGRGRRAPLGGGISTDSNTGRYEDISNL
jgi:hypothetical protein